MPIFKRRPESDWTCREVLDARAVDPATGQSRCEFCGTCIRWIHALEHDDYHRAVEAGCCCAARLCFDYNAEAAERELKNRMARLARFIDLGRWKRSRISVANIWRFVKTPDGARARVTIFVQDGMSLICVARKHDRYFHPARYATQAEALAVAFELVDRSEQGGEADR